MKEKETIEKEETEKKERKEEENPYDSSNWFNRIYTGWMDKFLFKGFRKPMELIDIPKLPKMFDPKTAEDKFEKKYLKFRKNGDSMKKALGKAFIVLFMWKVILAQIMTICKTTVELLSPIIQLFILQSMFPDAETPAWITWEGTGLCLSAGLCVIQLVTVFLEKYSTELSNLVFMELMIILFSRIYNKLLTISPKAFSSQTEDQSFITMLTVEIWRVSYIPNSISVLFTTPVIFIVSVVLLFVNLQWAGFVCLGAFIFLVPLYYICSFFMSKSVTKVYSSLSAVTKVISEVIQGIKIIKLNVWESKFVQKILAKKRAALGHLWTYLFFALSLSGLSSFTPVVIEVPMFIVVFLVNTGGFTISKVFSSMTYIKLLSSSISYFPMIFGQLIDGFSAYKRISLFLDLEEKEKMAIVSNESEKYAIVCNNCTFQYTLVKDKPIFLSPMQKYMIKMKKTMAKKAAKALKAAKKKERELEKKQEKDLKKKEQDPKKKEEELKDQSDIQGKKDDLTKEKEKDVVKKKVEKKKDAGKKTIPVVAKPTPTKLFEMKNINIKFEKGKFYCIWGKVGSGKSTLLNGILRELEVTGDVMVDGSISYCEQKAWIQNESVLDNITFGSEYDEERFQMVVDSAQLTHDIQTQFPQGVGTSIGEKGITISGGQKQRIAVARALYADSDIYLFDDVFSAVDPKIGSLMFKKVILGSALKGKTKIVVSNQLDHFSYADQVIILKDMKIVEQGTYDEVIGIPDGIFAKVIRANTVSGGGKEGTEKKVVVDLKEKEVKSKNPVKLKKEKTKEVMQLEELEKGTVKLSTFWFYIRNLGCCDHWCCSILTIVLFALVIILSVCSLSGPSVWLSIWLSAPVNETVNGTMSNSYTSAVEIPGFTDYHYLFIYIGLGCLVPFTLMLQYCITGIVGINAGYQIQKRVLGRLFRSPLRFFQTTPLGRILLRLSSDQLMADYILIVVLGFFTMLLAFVFVIFFVGFTNYLVLIPLLLLSPLYLIVFELYRRNARQVQRNSLFLSFSNLSHFELGINTVARAPVSAFFQETVAGIRTIRGYGAVQFFMRQNREKVAKAMKTPFISYEISIWTNFRLGLLNFLLFSCIIFLVVGFKDYSFGFSVFSGLTLSSVLSIAPLLRYFIQSLGVFETRFNSIERLKHYSYKLDSEKKDQKRSPKNWPSTSHIKFDNISMRYRTDTPIVLKNISFEIPNNSRVGIAGRSGSGKSSLFEVLMRTVEPCEGSFFIDNVDATSMDLSDLRRKIVIIPQNPYLFTDSIRGNLDPIGEFDDAKIWEVLEKCSLKDFVKNLPKQLNQPAKMSVGQSQLLCLGRALLYDARIVCFDEATANIDIETEKAIQQTISEGFTNSTILVIAHRINTIIKSDLVLVLSNGGLVEFDSPKNLVTMEKYHIFKQLISDLGKETERKLYEMIDEKIVADKGGKTSVEISIEEKTKEEEQKPKEDDKKDVSDESLPKIRVEETKTEGLESEKNQDYEMETKKVPGDVKTDGSQKEGEKAEKEWLVAKFDYKAKTEGDLSFVTGEEIELLEKREEGWWYGKTKKGTGMFPVNYVTKKE